jgi:hypothetical protein
MIPDEIEKSAISRNVPKPDRHLRGSLVVAQNAAEPVCSQYSSAASDTLIGAEKPADQAASRQQ